MNVRSIKQRNTQRIRSWIPRSIGNCTTLTSSLQLIRMYGAPDASLRDIPTDVIVDMVCGPKSTLSVVRVYETDQSEVVQSTSAAVSWALLSSERGPC